MNARSHTVAAVIVLHNSAATLRVCLQALLAQRSITEVVLVDNASDDDWEALLPDDARVCVVRNADNPGFAVACNQGAARSSSPWLLFLNPDCLLPDDAVQALLEVAEGAGGSGLLGAQLLEEDGRLQPASRRLPATPRQMWRGRLHLPDPPWSTQPERAPEFEPLEALSGALMLMPRSLFGAVGGFDAGYRLHCEDLDLCRRVRDSGAWVGIAPRVRVRHLKGTSSRRRPFWVEWQKHRGLWRYYSKFDRPAAAWWTSLLVAAMLVAHFPWAALRAWWRSRRALRTPGSGSLPT